MRRKLLSYAVIFTFAALLPLSGIAADSPNQLSGTVVSVSSSSLVLSTDNGQQSFTLDSATAQPAALKAGDSVEVWFRNSGDQKVATRITEGSSSSASYDSSANSDQAAASSDQSDQASSQSAESSEMNESAQSERAELPHTGSSLPLVGFVGLLALGAGVAVRMVVKA